MITFILLLPDAKSFLLPDTLIKYHQDLTLNTQQNTQQTNKQDVVFPLVMQKPQKYLKMICGTKCGNYES